MRLCYPLFKCLCYKRLLQCLLLLLVGILLIDVCINHDFILHSGRSRKDQSVLFVKENRSHDNHQPVKYSNEISKDTDSQESQAELSRTNTKSPSELKKEDAVKALKQRTEMSVKFLPDYKNPCWFEGDQTERNLRCIPYFYMLGVGKCGSTTLCECMNFHPEIAKPKIKELWYWNGAQGARALSDVARSYPKNFVNASLGIFHTTTATDGFEKYHPRITYDCTPVNVHLQWLPKLLKKIDENARVIIIMRTPSARAYSEYHHRKVVAKKKITPEEFDKQMRDSINSFNSCLMKNPIEQCVMSAKNHSEEMYSKKVEALETTFDFLSMTPPNETTREKIRYCMNNRIYPGMVENRMVIKIPDTKLPYKEADVSLMKKAKAEWSEYRDTMLPKTRKLLDDFYAPYNKMLAEFLDDDRFLFNGTRT